MSNTNRQCCPPEVSLRKSVRMDFQKRKIIAEHLKRNKRTDLPFGLIETTSHVTVKIELPQLQIHKRGSLATLRMKIQNRKDHEYVS